jgi:protein gp37
MAENSKIEWTHHTFNPWTGCAKVSPGCTNCYAEAMMDKRWGKAKWGPNGTRIVASESYWRQPLKWDRDAKAANERRRVFCASLADVFEGRGDLENPRLRLFDLIRQTPDLDWLLLTKRPENIFPAIERAMYPKPAATDGPDDLYDWLHDWSHGRPPGNVWLGTSVEDQRYADKRIPHLLKTPAAVRFLSCEPLLGPVNFMRVVIGKKLSQPPPDDWRPESFRPATKLDWIIVGGESGPGARPMDVTWSRFLVKQCKAAGVACFVKQLGSNPHQPVNIDGELSSWPLGSEDKTRPDAGNFWPKFRDRKGGDPTEWPEDLRVREFPAGAVLE